MPEKDPVSIVPQDLCVCVYVKQHCCLAWMYLKWMPSGEGLESLLLLFQNTPPPGGILQWALADCQPSPWSLSQANLKTVRIAWESALISSAQHLESPLPFFPYPKPIKPSYHTSWQPLSLPNLTNVPLTMERHKKPYLVLHANIPGHFVPLFMHLKLRTFLLTHIMSPTANPVTPFVIGPHVSLCLRLCFSIYQGCL